MKLYHGSKIIIRVRISGKRRRVISIRQYEQNPDSIGRAEARAVRALAQALGCRTDDLLPVQVGATS